VQLAPRGPERSGTTEPHLRRGDLGPAVNDLQQRLDRLGHPCAPDPPGSFGPATAAALEAFERSAGLDPDERVGSTTWQALVEAGYHLGERQLYLRSPMTRGDDVADLQRRLGALGFDAGRVDGIFGPDTARALSDFQRNSGLVGDGIFGPDTVAALARLGLGRTDAVNVAHVRELERLRETPRGLKGRRAAIGEPGGLGALASAIAHDLRERDVTVAVLEHPDWSAQAREANAFGADVYLGLRLQFTRGHRVGYFRTTGFESSGGRRLAELLTVELTSALACEGFGPCGLRLPVLRETRMPAVLCEAGTPADVVGATSHVARAIVDGVQRWAAEPLPSGFSAAQVP
jgi:N-acetylmuramoyl-L-alanine amidase